MTQLESLLIAGITLILSNGITLLLYFLARKDRDKYKDAFQESLLKNFETFNHIVELTDQIEDKAPVEKSIAEVAASKVQDNFIAHKIHFNEEPTRHSLQHIRIKWREKDNEVRNRNTSSNG